MIPRGVLNKVLHGDAPLKGPTLFPFIYHAFLQKKVPLSYTYYHVANHTSFT